MSKDTETSPLGEHLDGLVDDLRRFIPAALAEFEEEAVHKARVTTRRLKAALLLLSSVLDEDRSKPFSKLGRKLRRRLGPLRDIDVMVGHLDEIKPTSKLTPAVEWVRQRLLAQREHARVKSTKKAPPTEVLSKLGSWWAIRQDMIDVKPEVDSLLQDSVHTQLEQFIDHADNLAPGRDPHALRIAGKSLRYTLELAQAEGHKLPKMLLRTFKKMQEHLGVWHDFVVLAERTMQACIDEDLPLHDPVMQRLVLELINHCMKQSQRELDRFGKLWKERGPEIALAIRETFPVKEAVIEQKTGLDPAGSPIPPAPEVASTSPPPAA